MKVNQNGVLTSKTRGWKVERAFKYRRLKFLVNSTLESLPFRLSDFQIPKRTQKELKRILVGGRRDNEKMHRNNQKEVKRLVSMMN